MIRRGGRRFSGWLAIAAIALHTVLLGIAAPMAAGATVDPFSVICHSGAQATPDDQSPASPAPSHACDHCNLCSASAPPAALDTTLARQLTPTRLLHVLVPAAAALRDGLADNPNRARGPPYFA